MINDYIVFLSGSIPHGIPILFALLILFAVGWLFVWKGTKFWSGKYYWKIVMRGYFVIITAYIIFWLNTHHYPFPIRIIITDTSADSLQKTSWQAVAALQAIQRHLYYSSENYILLTESIAKPLQQKNITRESVEYLAEKMNTRWVIYVEPGESAQLVSVIVKKYRWGSYRTKKSISTNIVNYQTAKNLANMVAGLMGEKRGSYLETDLSIPPESQRGYYRAKLLLHKDAPDSAFALFEVLAEKFPDSFELRRDLAKCRLASRAEFYREEIKWHLSEALRLNNDDAEVLLMLGKILLQYRQWDEAESALKLSYHLNQDDPRIYLLMARLAKSRIVNLGFENNEQLMYRAIYLAPGYEAARIAISKLKIGRLKKREALVILNAGLAVDSSSQRILLSKTAVLIELNQHVEAAQTCQLILDKNSGHAGALYNLGIILLWQKEFDRALTMFDSSWHNGGTVDNFYYKGVAYQQMEDWESAILEFQRRLAHPLNARDRAAISARERIKMLRWWIAERDSAVTQSK